MKRQTFAAILLGLLLADGAAAQDDVELRDYQYVPKAIRERDANLAPGRCGAIYKTYTDEGYGMHQVCRAVDGRFFHQGLGFTVTNPKPDPMIKSNPPRNCYNSPNIAAQQQCIRDNGGRMN